MARRGFGVEVVLEFPFFYPMCHESNLLLHIFYLNGCKLLNLQETVSANEWTFRQQVPSSVFSSLHNCSQRQAMPSCSNHAQKASTQSKGNLLFTHLCFLTIFSDLKICYYFCSPVWIPTQAHTAVISPAVFINCWLTQILFLSQLSFSWHITQLHKKC